MKYLCLVYLEGDKLHAVPNVYTYLDFAHSGWLGWDNNLSQTVQLYTDVAKGTAAGTGVVGVFDDVAIKVPNPF